MYCAGVAYTSLAAAAAWLWPFLLWLVVPVVLLTRRIWTAELFAASAVVLIGNHSSSAGIVSTEQAMAGLKALLSELQRLLRQEHC
jgi:hypothetical protein